MYNTLVTNLQAITGLSFAEYEWATRPASDYGTVRIDVEGNALNGNDRKQYRKWLGSVDVFLHKPNATKEAAVENVLTGCCGAAWKQANRDYETSTGLLHITWDFELEG